MTPTQFLAWRKARGWSQKEAAAALGLSSSRIIDYEAGITRTAKGKPSRPAPIPRTVALACAAIALGLRDYPAEPVASQKTWLNSTAPETVDLMVSEAPVCEASTRPATNANAVDNTLMASLLLVPP